MTRDEIVEILDEKAKDCTLYRELYQAVPEAFKKPVYSWKEFCTRLFDCGKPEGIKLPDDAPTPIEAFLTEKAFFYDNAHGDVSVIVNVRYCPAFLHKLEFIKVVYVFRGNCSFFCDGKRIELAEGNICLVAPGVQQAVFSCGDRDIVLNLLLRRSTFMNTFPELLESGEGGIITDFFWKMLMGRPGGKVMLFLGSPQPLLEESVLELYEETVLSPIKSRLIARSMMIAIFAYILRWDEREAVNLETGKKEQRIYPLPGYLRYMKQNLENVTLSSLAANFYISEGYLSRYIKKETGETFSSLLKKMRMSRAEELLVNTECNIERIVELIGYTDQSIFYENFKEEYGMTPISYRKKKRRTGFMELQI